MHADNVFKQTTTDLLYKGCNDAEETFMLSPLHHPHFIVFSLFNLICSSLTVISGI